MITKQTLMTPGKALSHLEFKTRKNSTEKDVQAINTLVDYINNQNKSRLNDTGLFAKLFIDKFLTLALTRSMDASSIISEINNILSKDMIDLMKEFQRQIPFLKLDQYVYRVKRSSDIKGNAMLLDVQEKAVLISNMRFEDLANAFNQEYSLDEAQDFICTQVNKSLNNYA